MVFDVDGTCLRAVPRRRRAETEKYACSIRQGAYKAVERNGLVFAYMGPPDEEPPFPEWEGDFTVLPGDELVPFSNFQHCNWLQVQDNAADNYHPTALHAGKSIGGGITRARPSAKSGGDRWKWRPTCSSSLYIMAAAWPARVRARSTATASSSGSSAGPAEP